MNLAEIEKINTEFRKADAEMVEAWNSYARWNTPVIEQRVNFLSDRLLLASSALADLLNALTDK